MFDPVALHQIVIAVFLAVALRAAYSDLTMLRISNRCNVMLLALYPVYLSFSQVTPEALPALGIAVLVLSVGFLLFIKGVLGAGDVKMLAVVSLWAGPDLIVPFFTVTALVGGGMSILLISRFHMEASFLAHRCGATNVSQAITGQKLPYGVAIASGAGYVAYHLFFTVGV